MKSKAQPAGPNIKIAAILLGLIAIFVQNANAQTEAQVPGDIRIARWDVILNDNGLESVDSVDGRTVDTRSTLYQAAIFKADDLRQAVNAAAGAGGLEGGSQSMAYTQIYNSNTYNMQPLFFNYFRGQDSHAGIQGDGTGDETYGDVKDGHIRVFLDYAHLNIHLLENANGRRISTNLSNEASIHYDGQLTPGDALAFSATIKTRAGNSYRHMIVWEAFKAEARYQENLQMLHDSQRWCQIGPQGIRNASDIALVWAAGAKHLDSVVAPKWEQKLEDGKTVRLVGITRTDKWLYCWWDADGQPVATTGWIQFGKNFRNKPIWFSAQVIGSADEWKMQFPSGHPDANHGVQTGPFTTSIATVVDQSGQASVGVPVGPWQQVGEIKKGGSIKVDGNTYTLPDVEDNAGHFIFAPLYLQQTNRVDDDEIVTLSAVTLDGTEIDTNDVPTITSKNYGVSQPEFQNMTVANLKLFHVWKRKIQWVTFTGFATEPTTPPKDQVTPAEVTAAVGAQQNQQQQIQNQTFAQQFAALKDKRKEWDAIPPDPTTPKGALRALFQSAAKGDLAAVRARMKSSQAGSDPMLDISARFITANQSARATAVARFGHDKVQDLQVVSNGTNQLPGLMDLETGMVGLTWQPRPDGGLTADQVAVIKGDDGTYYLDTSPTKLVNGVQQSQAATTTMLLSMVERMEQINQLLKDNPSLTIDQLRHALSEPAALPTTQLATTHPS